MSQDCYKCSRTCVLREEKLKLFGFPCDFCRKIVCSECTKALAGEIRFIPSPSRTTIFVCPDCKDAIKNLPEIRRIMQKTDEDLKQTQQQGEATAKSLQELKLEVDSLKTSMERRKKENEATKGELVKVRNEIEQVHQKVPGRSYADALKKLEEKVETIKTSEMKEAQPAGVELTLFEIREREHRANNILFFGVDESQKQDTEEKVNEDKETVKRLFTLMNSSLPETAKLFRLGREMASKKRPIKVILPDRQETLKALKNRKILEEKEPGVYAKADQTEHQRKYLKQILQDLEKQKSDGKENLIIKYINGIPKIIEKTAKN